MKDDFVINFVQDKERERGREREILDLAKVQSDKSFVFMKPWQ